MARPKKEYVEREADETGTPFQRFERALKKIMAVPKATVVERERELKERRAAR